MFLWAWFDWPHDAAYAYPAFMLPLLFIWKYVVIREKNISSGNEKVVLHTFNFTNCKALSGPLSHWSPK